MLTSVTAILVGFAVALSPVIVRVERHDLSLALRLSPPVPAMIAPEHAEPEDDLVFLRPRLGFDPMLQTAVFRAAPRPLLSFDGIGPSMHTANGNPPDANGDVGRDHYVQMTNFWFAIFSKTGQLLYGPSAMGAIWRGFAGVCGHDDAGDPVVLYDHLADRWVMMNMSWNLADGFSHQCVAVSQSPDPTGSWYRYQFAYPPSNDAGKLGLWPDAYVYTTLITSDGIARVCLLDRAQMLEGRDASQQCFEMPMNE